MVAFYNQGDQDIYDSGIHFRPQQKYLQNNFQSSTQPTETISETQDFGIPYTGAFTNFNRNDSNTGGFGTWGNLDESSAKQFNIDGNIVTGYKNLSSGLYQDKQGLNIQNLGLAKKEEDAEYPGLFHKVNVKSMLKNPSIIKSFFDRQDVEKQAELQKEIDTANDAAAAENAAHQARVGRYEESKASGRTGGGWYGGDDYSGGLAGDVSQAGPGRDADDKMAKGGRTGYFFGGRAEFAKGGRIGLLYGGNPNEERSHSLAGTHAGENATQGGTNDGNQNNILKNNYLDVETDLLRTNPSIDFNLKSPLDIAKLQATIGYRNLVDNDDLSVEGKLGTDLGLFNTNTNFTETGIGDTDINYGNFSTTVDANKNLKNIGYNNTWNGINYGVNTDLDNTMFSAGINFKNGGLAGIL